MNYEAQLDEPAPLAFPLHAWLVSMGFALCAHSLSSDFHYPDVLQFSWLFSLPGVSCVLQDTDLPQHGGWRTDTVFVCITEDLTHLIHPRLICTPGPLCLIWEVAFYGQDCSLCLQCLHWDTSGFSPQIVWVSINAYQSLIAAASIYIEIQVQEYEQQLPNTMKDLDISKSWKAWKVQYLNCIWMCIRSLSSMFDKFWLLLPVRQSKRGSWCIIRIKMPEHKCRYPTSIDTHLL